MLRKWVVLIVTCGGVAGLVSGSARAADKDSPLAKIMKQIDVETKKVRDATTTALRFKKSAKEVVESSETLARLGKETKPFKEPSVAQKKPYDKWVNMAEKYIEASDEMAKAATKGDFNAAKRAWSNLNNTCSNCHGAFRPEVGDDF